MLLNPVDSDRTYFQQGKICFLSRMVTEIPNKFSWEVTYFCSYSHLPLCSFYFKFFFVFPFSTVCSYKTAYMCQDISVWENCRLLGFNSVIWDAEKLIVAPFVERLQMWLKDFAQSQEIKTLCFYQSLSSRLAWVSLKPLHGEWGAMYLNRTCACL